MKAVLLFITSIFFFNSVFADCASDRCDDVLIESIELTANGDLTFTTTGDENRLFCDVVNGNSIRVLKTTSFDEVYALLVSSQKSESLVSVRIDSSAYDCELVTLTTK